MSKWNYSFTPSQRGVQILPSVNLLTVLNMSLIIQWYSKLIFWFVFSPDLMDIDLPSIHIIPQVM